MRSSFSRRALALTGIAATAALALSGCAADSNSTDGDAAESITIGISQFVQHPALDAATAGFKQAFVDAGYVDGETVTFDEQNAQADVANTNTIAQKFAADNLDLVLAVATPSAQAAAQNITDIPVLFTAVTDAVGAELVNSDEEPGANVTGTIDLNPDAMVEQFDLLKEIVPGAKKVGIVYSSGEVNSEIQVKLAKEIAGKLDIEIVETTVSNASEIKQATEALGDVDAIYVPTDNVVVSAISTVVQVGEDKQIPVIGAEAGTVEGGAIATIGIDYTKLGYQTGEMAIKVLEGADPATMPVEMATELELIINTGAAERMGVTLPESIVDSADRVIE